MSEREMAEMLDLPMVLRSEQRWEKTRGRQREIEKAKMWAKPMVKKKAKETDDSKVRKMEQLSDPVKEEEKE
jgi:hypothetical protein